MDGVRIAVLVVAFLGVARMASRGRLRRSAPVLLTAIATEALATVAVAWPSPPVLERFAPLELDPPPPAPEGGRVLFIGDSFTQGQGVAARERFADRVIEGLVARGDAVEGVNHGIRGTGLYLHDALVGGYSTAISEPDLVLWTVVLNDLGGGTPGSAGGGLQDDFIGDRRWRTGTPSRALDLFLGVLATRATAAATEASYRDSFGGDAGARMEAVFRPHAEALRARGARLVVVIFPLLHRLDAYPFTAAHETIGASARAAGADVIDLLPAFEGRDARSLWVSRADHHPNAEGHRIAAEAILAALGPVPRAGPPDCSRPEDPRGQAEAALCAAPRDPDALLRWGAYWRDAPQAPGPMDTEAPVIIAAFAAAAIDPSRADDARRLVSTLPPGTRAACSFLLGSGSLEPF